jgi:hypothetical protein
MTLDQYARNRKSWIMVIENQNFNGPVREFKRIGMTCFFGRRAQAIRQGKRTGTRTQPCEDKRTKREKEVSEE